MGENPSGSNKETKRRAAAGRSGRLPRLTDRDRDIVRWVHVAGVATRAQLQKLFFGPGGRTRCQERLTMLVRHRFLERLTDGRVNSPYVYRVSRRAVNGRRLLRAEGLGDGSERRSVPPWRLQHSLAIAGCRVQVVRACGDGDVSLLRWLDEDELGPLTKGSGILPDAYFQLTRMVGMTERRSAFFLEVERSGKSDRALREKLRRYGDFYYGGHFAEAFGTRALRVLVLFGSEFGLTAGDQVERVRSLADDLGVTNLCLAPLDAFLGLDPAEALRAPIWSRPGHSGRVPLLPPAESTSSGGETDGV